MVNDNLSKSNRSYRAKYQCFLQKFLKNNISLYDNLPIIFSLIILNLSNCLETIGYIIVKNKYSCCVLRKRRTTTRGRDTYPHFLYNSIPNWFLYIFLYISFLSCFKFSNLKSNSCNSPLVAIASFLSLVNCLIVIHFFINHRSR